MSCCGNHKHGDQNQEGKGQDLSNMKKHNWFMKVCCFLPIVLIGIMLVTNSANGISSNILTYSLLLLCPLSHLVLMPLMMRSVIDNQENKVIAQVKVGTTPNGISFMP